MQYVFITVNFNNAKETIKYLKSIKMLSAPKGSVLRVIVVDNCSIKSDFSLIEDFCRSQDFSNIEVSVVRNEKNIGYFAGLNVGLNLVKGESQKTCIIGNNDVVFSERFLLDYEQLKLPEEAIVVCPDIVNRDGKHENPQLAGRASLAMKAAFRIYFTHYLLSVLVYNVSRLMKRINLRKANTTYNSEQFIYQGSGACYVLPEVFFKCYQLLDDRVFLWGEERLLANQVVSVGRKTWYAPTLKVRHNESMSTSKVPSKEAWKINKESYKIYREYM